jgi:eukaryotic-like serine/threonine-protein kinase
MKDLIGQSIGRYHILEQIGEGGMAVVYKAFDTRLETEVAIKFIRTEKLTIETMGKSLKRFEREAKALAQLTHPNIVRVIDYGDHEERPYLVMPYLKGGTLKQILGKPIPYRQAANLIAPIAHALEYAHQHNVLHRDVKPSNILLTDSGQPMLSDFGIAKILEDELTTDLTGTGVGIGTPEYMAPEQGMSHTIDHRVDIYSLGTVYYEMITGRRPYQADTPLAILFKRASEPLPRPGQYVRDLPDSVERVLVKALAKDPAERYPTADAFAVALEDLSRGQPVAAPKGGKTEPNRRWGWTAGLSVLVCLAALGSGLLVRGVLSNGSSGGFPTSTLESQPLDHTILPETATAAVTSQPTPLPPEMTATEFIPISTLEPSPSKNIGKDGMELVYIPEGDFVMGSQGGDDDEQPVHSVYISSFWIDQTEVTNAMFAGFLNEMGNQSGGGASWLSSVDPDSMIQLSGGAWKPVPGYENMPVVDVTWYGASAYCAWAGRRLPTEAEWEKAARGTNGGSLPWGGPLDCMYANFGGCKSRPVEVGSYPDGQSPYGVMDMLGNVWEWVYDKYGTDYYKQSPLADPTGPSTGRLHVLRGAAWDTSDPKRLRVTFRYDRDANSAGGSYGFRCALSAKE